MVTKVGFARGTCPKCGKLLIRKRPADLAVCDCFKLCPLCGKEMTPFTPDPTPSTYGADEAFAVKGQAVESSEWKMETLFYCTNHVPPYYSSQKPVEVQLR